MILVRIPFCQRQLDIYTFPPPLPKPRRLASHVRQRGSLDVRILEIIALYHTAIVYSTSAAFCLHMCLDQCNIPLCLWRFSVRILVTGEWVWHVSSSPCLLVDRIDTRVCSRAYRAVPALHGDQRFLSTILSERRNAFHIGSSSTGSPILDPRGL